MQSLELKNHKKNETNNKQTNETNQSKTKQQKNETLFSIFSVDILFRFSRYGNGVKGENKNYLKFFVKTLYKKKNVWYYVDEKAYRLP